ncbi:MAG: hypothetical protein P8X88_04610 [Gammaproteobacteria bacterium]
MSNTDLMQYFYTDEDSNSIPINVVLMSEFEMWKNAQSEYLSNWIEASRFKVKECSVLCVPSVQGKLEMVLVIADADNMIWSLGACPKQLPAGKYYIASSHKNNDQIYLGWGLGAYRGMHSYYTGI